MISRRPVRGRDAERGFTLIEIMVVVVMIGFLATALMIRAGAFSRGDKELREQVRRFDVLFHLAWEQAQIEGRSIGVQVETDRYAFYSYDPLTRQWSDMATSHDMFAARELDPEITLDLRMENQSVELPKNEDDDDDGLDVNPQVLLMASGETTPFSLYVEAEFTDNDYELVVDVLGDSEVIVHDRGF